MLTARVIPCLLLRNAGLVKTVKFANPTYLGDPINVVRIFNDKEVDELIFLDITATPEGKEPPYKLLTEIASECFMPLAYGGGITRVDQAERILKLGVEKVCLNTQAVRNPALVTEAAGAFGSQSVVVAIDVKRNFWGRSDVYVNGGRQAAKLDPVEHARRMADAGAGELLINSIDRDGTYAGYDLDLVRRVTEAVRVPVIACGGAASVEDLGRAVKEGGASAAAAGSLFVFHGKHRAVLINFPKRAELERVLA